MGSDQVANIIRRSGNNVKLVISRDMANSEENENELGPHTPSHVRLIINWNDRTWGGWSYLNV